MSGSPVLLFLDVSGGELLVILLVVFLVFGPEKMPDMARKAGRLMNQLKKATNDLTNEFKKETSVVQNEINAAHAKIDDQVESVRRELNRTKAQVTNDLTIENKSAPTGGPAVTTVDSTSKDPVPTEPLTTEENATKTVY